MTIQATGEVNPVPHNTGTQKLAEKIDQATEKVKTFIADTKERLATALEKKADEHTSPREVDQDGVSASELTDKIKHFVEETADRIKDTFVKEEAEPVKVEPKIFPPPTQKEMEAFSVLASFITTFQNKERITTKDQYEEICRKAKAYMGTDALHPLRPSFAIFLSAMEPKLKTLSSTKVHHEDYSWPISPHQKQEVPKVDSDDDSDWVIVADDKEEKRVLAAFKEYERKYGKASSDFKFQTF